MITEIKSINWVVVCIICTKYGKYTILFNYSREECYDTHIYRMTLYAVCKKNQQKWHGSKSYRMRCILDAILKCIRLIYIKPIFFCEFVGCSGFLHWVGCARSQIPKHLINIKSQSIEIFSINFRTRFNLENFGPMILAQPAIWRWVLLPVKYNPLCFQFVPQFFLSPSAL